MSNVTTIQSLVNVSKPLTPSKAPTPRDGEGPKPDPEMKTTSPPAVVMAEAPFTSEITGAT
jgi:hypothetical protein